MARKKIRLAFIANEASRKAVYKKRKAGLLKKINELSVLCGIESCAIIYPPYDAQPEIWPTVPEAKRVISKFKSMPEWGQKRMINQESFIRERIMKTREQLNKERQNNIEQENKETMFRCLMGVSFQNMGTSELNNLARVLENISL